MPAYPRPDVSNLSGPFVVVLHALFEGGVAGKEWSALLLRVLGLTEDAVPHLVGILHVHLWHHIAREMGRGVGWEVGVGGGGCGGQATGYV